MLLNEIAGHGVCEEQHDPVCGLVLDPDGAAPAVEESGVRHSFCSEDCRRAFVTRRLERNP
jgi:YHS domain-containing protein